MNRIESLGVVKQAGYRYCMLSKLHKREKKKEREEEKHAKCGLVKISD